MPIEVILPPQTGQDIGRNEPYVFDVRANEDVRALTIGLRFPRILPTEVAYAGDILGAYLHIKMASGN